MLCSVTHQTSLYCDAEMTRNLGDRHWLIKAFPIVFQSSSLRAAALVSQRSVDQGLWITAIESERTKTWRMLALVTHSIALCVASITAARAGHPVASMVVTKGHTKRTQYVTHCVLWPIRVNCRASSVAVHQFSDDLLQCNGTVGHRLASYASDFEWRSRSYRQARVLLVPITRRGASVRQRGWVEEVGSGSRIIVRARILVTSK